MFSHRQRLLLLFIILFLAQLACITSKKTVILRPDGSGEIRLEGAVPASLGDPIDREETITELEAAGWQNVQFNPELTAESQCSLTTEQQTAAIDAFNALMPVFSDSNCANCHGGVTDPYASDTNHPDGQIEAGRTCDECHIQADAFGPGAWRLAPPELAFVDRSAEQICMQVKAFHTSANGFIGHLEGDPLIGFAFDGLSAGAADNPHPPNTTRAELLLLAAAWQTALGVEPADRFWPGGQEGTCGCALVEPAPEQASGVSDVLTADYAFTSLTEESTAEALSEFTSSSFTSETQSDGSVIYTFEAVADLTDLAEAWDEVVNVYAKEGISLEPREGAPEDMELTTFYAPEEVQQLIDTYGEPHIEIVVVLPGDTTQSASGWENTESLLAGGTDSARFVWEPGDPVVTGVSIVRIERPVGQDGVGEQQEIDPDSVFEFAMQLPWSVPALGANDPDAVQQAVQNGGAPPSSLTQLETLRLLDAARRSSDPAVYGQFDGIDYAPVQLSGIEHRGVVVFPSGTDWQATGVVLDPWIAAYPAGVPVSEWADAVWSGGGVSPEIDSALGGLYPHAGGGEPSYPPDVERDDAVAFPPAGAYARSLFSRGPVSVLVVLPDGRHIGETPAGGMLNHLRGEAEMFKRLRESGEYDWWTFLPETGYRVEIFARQAGSLSVIVGSSSFEITDLRPGELLTFSVSADGTPGPVTRTGGIPVSDPDQEPAAQPGSGAPEAGEENTGGAAGEGAADPAGGQSAQDKAAGQGANRTLLIGLFSCMILAGLVMMGLSAWGFARRERTG